MIPSVGMQVSCVPTVALFKETRVFLEVRLGSWVPRHLHESDQDASLESLFHMKFDLNPDFSTLGPWPFGIC